MSQTHDNQEDGSVTILSQVDTFRFVAGIAFVATIILVIFSIYLWTKLNNTVDRLDAVITARIAEQKTSNEAAVDRCYSSATQGPALRIALRGLENAVGVAPDTKEALRNLRRTNALNVPTLAECRQLAEKLGVAIPKGAK